MSKQGLQRTRIGIYRSSLTFLDLKRYFMGTNGFLLCRNFMALSALFKTREGQNHRSNYYCFIKVHGSRDKQQLFYSIYFFLATRRCNRWVIFSNRNVILKYLVCVIYLKKKNTPHIHVLIDFFMFCSSILGFLKCRNLAVPAPSLL